MMLLPNRLLLFFQPVVAREAGRDILVRLSWRPGEQDAHGFVVQLTPARSLVRRKNPWRQVRRNAVRRRVPVHLPVVREPLTHRRLRQVCPQVSRQRLLAPWLKHADLHRLDVQASLQHAGPRDVVEERVHVDGERVQLDRDVRAFVVGQELTAVWREHAEDVQCRSLDDGQAPAQSLVGERLRPLDGELPGEVRQVHAHAGLRVAKVRQLLHEAADLRGGVAVAVLCLRT
jgi:hypothetical protein